MSLNIQINLDLSALSEEAIRAKLASVINRIKQEYSRQEGEKEADKEVIEEKKEQKTYENKLVERADPRQINNDPSVLNQRLDLKNYRFRDKLYGGFWIRYENRPEFQHALFCFTSPGSFGWRVLNYDQIYDSVSPVWVYDYGAKLDEFMQSLYGYDKYNFIATEDEFFHLKQANLDQFSIIPYNGSVPATDQRGNKNRAEFLGDYAIFGDPSREANRILGVDDGTLNIIHQLYRGRQSNGGVQFRFLPLIDEIGVLIISGVGATTAWYKEIAYEQVKAFNSRGDGPSNVYEQQFGIVAPQFYARQVKRNGANLNQVGKPPKMLFKSPPGGVKIQAFNVVMEVPHNSQTYDPDDVLSADMGHTIKFRLKMCTGSEWRNMMYNFNGTPQMETASRIPPESFNFISEDFGINILEDATITYPDQYFIGDPLRFPEDLSCNSDPDWCEPNNPNNDWSGPQAEDWLGQGIYHISNNPAKYSAYNWGFKAAQGYDTTICDPDASDTAISYLTLMNGTITRSEIRQLRIRTEDDLGEEPYVYERPYAQNTGILLNEQSDGYTVPEGYVVFIDFLEFEVDDPPTQQCDFGVYPGFRGLWSSGDVYDDLIADQGDGSVNFATGGIGYKQKLLDTRGIYGVTNLIVSFQMHRISESDFVNVINSRGASVPPNHNAYATVLDEKYLDTVSPISDITVRSFIMGPQVTEEIQTPSKVVGLVKSGALFNKPEKLSGNIGNDFIQPFGGGLDEGSSLNEALGWDSGRRLFPKNISYNFDNRVGLKSPTGTASGGSVGLRTVPYGQAVDIDLLSEYDGNKGFNIPWPEFYISANDHRPLAGRDNFPMHLSWDLFSSMDWRARPILNAQYTFSCKIKIRKNYAALAGYPNWPYTAPRATNEYGQIGWDSESGGQGFNAIKGNMQVAGLYSPKYMACNGRSDDANLYFTLVHVVFDTDKVRPRFLERKVVRIPGRDKWVNVSMTINYQGNDCVWLMAFNGQERFMTDIMTTNLQVEEGAFQTSFELQDSKLLFEGPSRPGSGLLNASANAGPSPPIWLMSDLSGNTLIPNDCMGIANEFGFYLQGNNSLGENNIAPADFFVPEYKTDAFGTPQSICFGPLATENTEGGADGGGASGFPAPPCENSPEYDEPLVCAKDQSADTPDLESNTGICLDRNKNVGQYIEPNSRGNIVINQDSLSSNQNNPEFAEAPPSRFNNPNIEGNYAYTSVGDAYTAVAGEQVSSGKTDPNTNPNFVDASRCADSRDYKTDQRYFYIVPESQRGQADYIGRVNQTQILRNANLPPPPPGNPAIPRTYNQGPPDDFNLGIDDACLLSGIDNENVTKDGDAKYSGNVLSENNCLTDGCTNASNTKNAGKICYSNRPNLPQPQLTEDGQVVDPCRDPVPSDPNDCELNRQKFESYFNWLQDSEYESNEFYNQGHSDGMPKFIGFASGGKRNVQRNIENLRNLGYNTEFILARAAGYTNEEISSGDINFSEIYEGEGLDETVDS